MLLENVQITKVCATMVQKNLAHELYVNRKKVFLYIKEHLELIDEHVM